MVRSLYRIGLLLLCAASGAFTACVDAGPATGPATITVITEGKTGFRVGDDFYPVGITAAEFQKRFGLPERHYLTELCYDTRGLEVAVNSATKVVGQMSFYFVDKDYTDVGSGKFHAGPIVSDKGVKAGASYDEIIKAHGKPSRDDQTFGPKHRTLEYPWGRFYLDDGVLEMIELGNGQF